MKYLYPYFQALSPVVRVKKYAFFIIGLFLMQCAAAQIVPGNAHFYGNNYDSFYRYIPGNNIGYEFSVEAWVKPGSTSGTMAIFSTRGANATTGDYTFDMKLQNGNSLHADIGDGTQWITTAADYPLNYSINRWYHIAYTVSSNITKKYCIYVNGELVASGPIISGPGAQFIGSDYRSGYIGANPRVGGEYFNGAIDEVKIYSGLLSQAQVQQDMVGTLTDFSGVVKQIYYNFNQSSGTVVNDGAGNALGPFNATAMNGSNWVESYAGVVPAFRPADVTSNTSFTAMWAAPVTGSFVDNYTLDVSTTPDFSTSLPNYPQTIANNVTSVNLNGLSASSNYYYRVRATKSGAGTGIWSSTASVSPPPGNAMLFNGTSQYISAGTGGQQVYQAFSVEAWIKIASNTGTKTIVSTNNASFSKGFEMAIIDDSVIAVDLGSISQWLAPVTLPLLRLLITHLIRL